MIISNAISFLSEVTTLHIYNKLLVDCTKKDNFLVSDDVSFTLLSIYLYQSFHYHMLFIIIYSSNIRRVRRELISLSEEIENRERTSLIEKEK